MNTRVALLCGTVVLVLAAAAGGTWWASASDSMPDAEPPPAPAEVLPVPPVPPRIAEGGDYDRCLDMVGTDPVGASTFADAWVATGGGEGATQCQALAAIALGNPEQGAELMEDLARRSRQVDSLRASLFGQAAQAWLMAGDPGRAYGADTMAVTLSPLDADLLIDRSVSAATMNRFQDALDDLNVALDLDPRRPDALVLRAAAWRHVGQLDLAQDDVDRALAQDPDNAEAFLERGILRQRRGDRGGAQQDWEHAMLLAPDSATADLAQQNLALLEAGPDQR